MTDPQRERILRSLDLFYKFPPRGQFKVEILGRYKRCLTTSEPLRVCTRLQDVNLKDTKAHMTAQRTASRGLVVYLEKGDGDCRQYSEHHYRRGSHDKTSGFLLDDHDFTDSPPPLKRALKTCIISTTRELSKNEPRVKGRSRVPPPTSCHRPTIRCVYHVSVAP